MIESILFFLTTILSSIISIIIWLIPFFVKIVGVIFSLILAIVVGFFSLTFGWLGGIFSPEPALSSPPPTTKPIVQVEQRYTPPPTPSHSPIRSPVSGSCSCPYDFAKNGSMCGGRSAYSRPGGDEPRCYLDD